MHAKSPFMLRRAKLGDVEQLFQLIRRATERGKILPRTRQNLRRDIRDFWVIEKAEKIIGCCALEIYSKKLAEVRTLAVLPGEEKQGLASQLVEACLDEARQRKIYEVLVITNRENIFRRHGFSEQLHDQKALFLRP